MKKVILAMCFVAAGVAASAQIFVGGTVGFDLTKKGPKDDVIKQLNITPKVGYQINDKFAVGIEAGYSDMGTIGYRDEVVAEDQKAWTAGVFGRYTAFSFKSLDFYAELGIGAMGLIDVKGSEIGVQANLVPGVAYEISDRFRLYSELNCLAGSFSTMKDQGFKFNGVATSKNLADTAPFTVGFEVKF